MARHLHHWALSIPTAALLREVILMEPIQPGREHQAVLGSHQVLDTLRMVTDQEQADQVLVVERATNASADRQRSTIAVDKSVVLTTGNNSTCDSNIWMARSTAQAALFLGMNGATESAQHPATVVPTESAQAMAVHLDQVLDTATVLGLEPVAHTAMVQVSETEQVPVTDMVREMAWGQGTEQAKVLTGQEPMASVLMDLVRAMALVPMGPVLETALARMAVGLDQELVMARATDLVPAVEWVQGTVLVKVLTVLDRDQVPVLGLTVPGLMADSLSVLMGPSTPRVPMARELALMDSRLVMELRVPELPGTEEEQHLTELAADRVATTRPGLTHKVTTATDTTPKALTVLASTGMDSTATVAHEPRSTAVEQVDTVLADTAMEPVVTVPLAMEQLATVPQVTTEPRGMEQAAMDTAVRATAPRLMQLLPPMRQRTDTDMAREVTAATDSVLAMAVRDTVPSRELATVSAAGSPSRTQATTPVVAATPTQELAANNNCGVTMKTARLLDHTLISNNMRNSNRAAV